MELVIVMWWSKSGLLIFSPLIFGKIIYSSRYNFSFLLMFYKDPTLGDFLYEEFLLPIKCSKQ